MRRVTHEQTYLDFSMRSSLKVVNEYRAKCPWISQAFDANDLILWLVHED